MRITMVGTGYVGLVTGACFANTGNVVTCLDIDSRKIEMLQRGESPIYEPGLSEMIARNLRAGRLIFTTDKAAAYEKAEIVFICVGTPPDAQTGHADLQYVLAAAEDVGRAIEATPGPTGCGESHDEPKIIVVKSTVPVGTNKRVEQAVRSQTQKPFAMASNPEFLKEGAAIADFTHPDRVVIGAADRETGVRMRELYDPFVRQGNPIFIMDIPSAEMVKYAANTMLATKISFINEIANLCEHFGADIDEVRRGMCSDSRIGNKFLYPGLGYGGSCFPKDVQACIAMAEHAAFGGDLLRAVHNVNQAQRQRFVQKILDRFAGDVTGKTFAVWGVAFKPGTDDIREAPALDVIAALLERGASVRVYDEVAAGNARKIFGDQVTWCDAALDAVAGVDALVICTNWNEFLQPDFDAMHRLMAGRVIFDGRNLYARETMQEHGFEYHSVGRGAVAGESNCR